MSDSERRDAQWTDDRKWRHRIREANGIDIHYVVAGPEDAAPLVLLHGFPECWWAWRRHIGPLSETFRLLVPDMRGYNRSEKPADVESYRLETLADDVAGLIDAEGYDSAHVVGHDWGGVVAFGVGHYRPTRLRRLGVLNAPYPWALRAQFTPRQALRSWYVGLFQLPAVPEWVLSAGDYARFERLFRETPVVDDAYTDADIRRYKRAWGRNGALRAMLDYYRAFGRQQIRALADTQSRRIEAETLLLWGERDRALGGHIPSAIGRRTDATINRYPDASHWLHAEFPAETAADIRTFLSR